MIVHLSNNDGEDEVILDDIKEQSCKKVFYENSIFVIEDYKKRELNLLLYNLYRFDEYLILNYMKQLDLLVLL